MRVERNPDGTFDLIPDPGERIAWMSSHGVAVDTSFVGGKTVVRFLPIPYYWFGSDVADDFSGPRRTDRNPRQWRLYADGTLVEGPKGVYNPSIEFPPWPEDRNEPAPPAGEGE
jgi:hypothetical protein